MWSIDTFLDTECLMLSNHVAIFSTQYLGVHQFKSWTEEREAIPALENLDLSRTKTKMLLSALDSWYVHTLVVCSACFWIVFIPIFYGLDIWNVEVAIEAILEKNRLLVSARFLDNIVEFNLSVFHFDWAILGKV